MRTGTMVLLLVAILAVAVWGFKAIGIFFATVVALVLAILLAGLIALWLVKRRMRRALRKWQATFAAANPPVFGGAGHRPAPGGPYPRDGAIDVEPTRIREEKAGDHTGPRAGPP